MPILCLRKLTGTERSPEGNRQPACYLALVAGATNAEGFLGIGMREPARTDIP